MRYKPGTLLLITESESMYDDDGRYLRKSINCESLIVLENPSDQSYNHVRVLTQTGPLWIRHGRYVHVVKSA